ncbi:ATP-binding protein [Micromonospora profundi]|uniref:ATP-binding protein n=1 Tax=Micromonospora TaxID=1873 RepID=UPI0033B57A35
MTDLVGRRSERDAVEKLISLARFGRSGSLVVRGEAGIGKTALLEHAHQTALASAFRVEPLAGVESETQFAFAGLHQFIGASLTEFIEACVRAGQPERATQAMEQFDAWARASGTSWALGLAANSRALMGTGSSAEDQYRTAIKHLGNSRMRGYLARAHLVYGE